MLNENPIVSVIIPAYNHSKYVEQAIESVIAQTYTHIELLVINDGSTDNTHERIISLNEACRERFVRFEYVNSQNKGLVHWLNYAIDWAKGTYFSALASDDAWLPTKTTLQIEALESNPETQMCYGRAILIDDHSEPTREQLDCDKYKSGMIFEDLFLMRFHPPVNYMWRRSVFDQIGRYAEGFEQEDLYMNLKVAVKFPILYINEILMYYRIFPSIILKRDPIGLFDSYKRILEEYRTHPLFHKALNQYRINYFWTLSGYAKHKLKALRALTLIRLGESNFKIFKGIIKMLVMWKPIK